MVATASYIIVCGCSKFVTELTNPSTGNLSHFFSEASIGNNLRPYEDERNLVCWYKPIIVCVVLSNYVWIRLHNVSIDFRLAWRCSKGFIRVCYLTVLCRYRVLDFESCRIVVCFYMLLPVYRLFLFCFLKVNVHR